MAKPLVNAQVLVASRPFFSRKEALAIYLGLSLIFYIGLNASLYMGLATFTYFFMLLGVRLRKNRPLHWRVMSFSMITDIGLVLILEATRSAVDTAVKFELTALQKIHILTSLVAVVLYLCMFYLGYKRYKDKKNTQRIKNLHMRFGITTLIFRSVGWLTMFSFLAK